MQETSEVAKKLKILRERTGLSIAKVADALGYPTPSGYNHYETRYKKQYLPQDLIIPLLSIFEPYGVSRRELLELAGLDVMLMEQKDHIQTQSSSIDTTLYTRAVIRVVEAIEKEPAYQQLPQSCIDKVALEVYSLARSYNTTIINTNLVLWVLEVMQEQGKFEETV